MRDCMRAANLRSSSVTYVTMPMTTLSTMKGAMMGAIQAGINEPRVPRIPSPESRIPVSSPVDLAKHRINRAHDRDDVSHLMARNDMRQHGEIGERGAAPLHSIRFGASIRDQVATDFATRPLDAGVGLPFRNSHLRHGLQPRA